MAATGQQNSITKRAQYTSISSADTTWNTPAGMADWVLIVGAGSTVLVDEAGTSRTFVTDANLPNLTLPGPWQAFTSTTAAHVFMGNGGVAPTATPPLPKTTVINGGGVTQIANMAALQALAATSIVDGQTFILQSDGSLWRYAAASVLTTDTSGPFLVATATTAGAGAFLRVDRVVDIALPVSSATADAAVLYTVPAGFRLQLAVPFWSVSVTFTTATAGAAGLKSSNAGLATAGDILGGSTGDLVATLVSTGAYAKGTVGTKINTPPAVLSAADTIIYNRIAGSYTAGTGIAHVPVFVELAPAA